jgi:hypothetical protein
MEQSESYEKYPLWIVAIANLLNLAIYALGFWIMLRADPLAALLYALYFLALEVRLVAGHCRDCYYHGKRCAFGKGTLSGMLFRRGNAEKFCSGKMSWKDMLPELLLFLAPATAATWLLIRKFNLFLLLALLALLLLNTVGNGLVRGKLACAFCRQRQLGCPADRLFNRKQPESE